MTDEIILVRYRELAASAILQGINDYLKSKQTEDDLKKWMSECSLFDYLGINRNYVYRHVLELKKEGVRNLKGFRTYGKKEF